MSFKSPEEQVEDSIISGLSEIFELLEIDCIPILSHQNGTEPTKDYVAINILTFPSTSRATFDGGYVSWDEGEQQAYQYKSSNYSPLVQLSFFGNNAGSNSFKLHDSLSGNSVVQELWERNNISSQRWTPLRRSPQLRGKTWINNWNYDHTFGVNVVSRQKIDWVEYVRIRSIVNEGAHVQEQDFLTQTK